MNAEVEDVNRDVEELTEQLAAEREMNALRTAVDALKPLPNETARRIVRYLADRFGQ